MLSQAESVRKQKMAIKIAKSKKVKSGAPKSKKANGLGSLLREDCLQILDTPRAKEVNVSKEQLLGMYENMVLTRLLDERCMMLQRQGRIGFYVPSFGQEAIHTGVAAALKKSDWIFPSYREPGVFLYRGAPLYEMICNLYGNKDDVCKGRQMPVHYSFADLKLFSVSSPIATQVIQAAGAALAAKIRKTGEVAVTFFGDGATSENDFHTGMTFGGVYKAPVVYICTNNQFAISVPCTKQTAARGLVDKAVGYGMPGFAVDGNDIFAVYNTVKEAVDRARRGEGPTFVECLTYRMGPHSSSDDPTRYRDERIYEAWKKRDPIPRFSQFLMSKKLWTEKQESALHERLKAKIAEAIERAEKQGPPSIEEMFTDVYKEMTPQLREQQEMLVKEGELRGKFENTSEAFPL